jgi:hypothetical protein
MNSVPGTAHVSIPKARLHVCVIITRKVITRKEYVCIYYTYTEFELICTLYCLDICSRCSIGIFMQIGIRQCVFSFQMASKIRPYLITMAILGI